MKKKIITAVALTAALALGAAPAFAADPSASNPGRPAKDTGAVTSEVSVSTLIDQINATIPLKVPLALDINGKAFGVGNMPTNYAIINSGYYPIKVTKAQASAVTTGWTLVQTDITPGTKPTGAIGDIAITLTPDPATGKGTAWKVSTTANEALDWKVPAATKPLTELVPTTVNIAISGSNSAVQKVITDPLTKLLDITYTVAGDTAPTPPAPPA